MPDSIIGALIALCSVLVAGSMQWFIEIWKAKRRRYQVKLDKEKEWLEEIYYARTIKAILNIHISSEKLTEWSDTNNQLKEIIFNKLSELKWHAAKLRQSSLNGMFLNRMFMPAADFTEANLKGTTLSNSFLPEAIFVKANLGSIDKLMTSGKKQQWGTSLFNSFFWRSDFTEADLTEADLTYTTFCFSEFWAAILKGADLSFSKFNNANLGDANLQNAKLINTDFTNSYIGKADFRGAKVDEFTINTLKKAEGVTKAFFDNEVEMKFKQ